MDMSASRFRKLKDCDSVVYLLCVCVPVHFDTSLSDSLFDFIRFTQRMLAYTC